MMNMEYNRQWSILSMIEEFSQKNLQLQNFLTRKEASHASTLKSLVDEKNAHAALSTEMSKLKALYELAKKLIAELTNAKEAI